MHSKKVIHILSAFNDREWRACYKYLKYCSKKEAQSLRLFEYIYKYRKDLQSPKLNKETVKRKLFIGTSDRGMLNIMSDLVKDIELFMITDAIKSEDKNYERRRLLMDLYKSKGLFKYFEKVGNDLLKELKSDKTIDIFHCAKWIDVHHALYFADMNVKKPEFLHIVEAEMGIQLYAKNLRVVYETEASNIKKFLGADIDNIKSRNDFSQLSELINHYQQLNVDGKDHSFEILKEHLLNEDLVLTEELSQLFMVSLINHCYLKIKSGVKEYVDHLATLYIFGLNSGLSLLSGKMSETRFLNIIDTISKSSIEVDMNGFISTWISEVNSKQIKGVEQMAHALFAFGKGHYGETLVRLNNHEIRLTHENISFRSRWMYICSLCSQYPDYDEFDDVIKASSAFFRRHQKKTNITTYRGSMNLITVVKMIWEKTPKKAILDFIDDCDYLMYRSWINKELSNYQAK